jgi:hypothetical protein
MKWPFKNSVCYLQGSSSWLFKYVHVFLTNVDNFYICTKEHKNCKPVNMKYVILIFNLLWLSWETYLQDSLMQFLASKLVPMSLDRHFLNTSTPVTHLDCETFLVYNWGPPFMASVHGLHSWPPFMASVHGLRSWPVHSCHIFYILQTVKCSQQFTMVKWDIFS